MFQFFIFDAKIRFALLALLRSAIFSEIEVDNYLVIFPARVNPLPKIFQLDAHLV